LLIYDEKVMEDVDDLSDTEKVSLISDIELCEEMQEGSSVSVTKTSGSRPTEPNIESKDDNLDMNLLKVQKLNLDKEKLQVRKTANRVSNGIMLTKSKLKCIHVKNCESCHKVDADSHWLKNLN